MLHIVLYRPEIPPNTGNVIRLCANTGAALHLVRPLGFTLDEPRLRRAGLDYHEWTRVQVHEDLEAVLGLPGLGRAYAFTTRAVRRHDAPRFAPNDVLIFGPETRGLPPELLDRFAPAQRLRIPMTATSRSLNLSNAVAIALYEAWRQLGFPGARPQGLNPPP